MIHKFQWTVEFDDEKKAVRITGQNRRRGGTAVSRAETLENVGGVARLLLGDEFDVLSTNNVRLLNAIRGNQ